MIINKLTFILILGIRHKARPPGLKKSGGEVGNYLQKVKDGAE